MTPDDLDLILAAREPIEASRDFAARTMAAVQRAAAEPPPRRFPWWRFAAGLVASGAMAGAGALLMARSAFGLELGYATAAVVVSLGLAAVPRVLAD